jgi:hypothetical protein
MIDVGGLICFQYRNIGASFIDEHVAGNMLQNVRVFHRFLARID